METWVWNEGDTEQLIQNINVHPAGLLSLWEKLFWHETKVDSTELQHAQLKP